jgi:glycogen debranching enzyme
MWSDDLGCYVDRRRDGLSDVLSIAGFWPLLAGGVPPERRARMIALLRDGKHFNRPHRVPTLSAAHPDYDAAGGYWLGGVWPPTTAMILAALRGLGEDALAHEIGLNHLDNVVQVFTDTGTVWENYAPESAAPGKPAKPDFTGWSGIGPVAVLIEEVFGLRLDVPARRLVWDLRLTDEHGIAALPFGRHGTVDVRVAARADAMDEPRIEASATCRVTLEVRWHGGSRVIELG